MLGGIAKRVSNRRHGLGLCLTNSKSYKGNFIMTDNEKLIALLDNVLSDIMGDLNTEISSHAATILSNEARFISEQIRHLKGKKNA
jgi:hypothetical protein